MGPEQVTWFTIVAIFFTLFLVTILRYRANPRVLSQLAIFSLLSAVLSAFFTVKDVTSENDSLSSSYATTTFDDRYQSWLQNSPVLHLFPFLSVLLFSANFDTQLRFFHFYTMVLDNYGRWAALHTTLPKYIVHDGDNDDDDDEDDEDRDPPGYNTPTSPMSPTLSTSTQSYPPFLWMWINIFLLLIYGLTVIVLLCCQFLLDDRSSGMLSSTQLLLANGIGCSVLCFCVFVNLISSVFTRYKMKHPSLSSISAASTTTALSAHQRHLLRQPTSPLTEKPTKPVRVPEDKSSRSRLVLIVCPLLYLTAILAIMLETWLIYWNDVHAPSSLESSSSVTLPFASAMIDLFLVTLPITVVIIINAFFIKPYPLIVASSDLNSLP